MKDFFLINSGDLVTALEDWMIDNKCNLSTPEEWARCMRDIQKTGKAEYMGSVEDADAKSIKESLKRDFNVKELKDLKEPNNENF